MLNLNAIKLTVIASVLAAGITFGISCHNTKVNEAVTVATTKIELDLAKQSLKAIEQRDRTILDLTEKVKQNDYQTKEQLRKMVVKYNSLLASYNGFNGLSERPKGTNSNSEGDNNSSTSLTKDRPAETTGRLYRQDAINLAEYARDTEELKINLLMCYKQYDDLAESLANLNTQKDMK